MVYIDVGPLIKRIEVNAQRQKEEIRKMWVEPEDSPTSTTLEKFGKVLIGVVKNTLESTALSPATVTAKVLDEAKKITEKALLNAAKDIVSPKVTVKAKPFETQPDAVSQVMDSSGKKVAAGVLKLVFAVAVSSTPVGLGLATTALLFEIVVSWAKYEEAKATERRKAIALSMIEGIERIKIKTIVNLVAKANAKNAMTDWINDFDDATLEKTMTKMGMLLTPVDTGDTTKRYKVSVQPIPTVVLQSDQAFVLFGDQLAVRMLLDAIKWGSTDDERKEMKMDGKTEALLYVKLLANGLDKSKWYTGNTLATGVEAKVKETIRGLLDDLAGITNDVYEQPEIQKVPK